MSCAATRTGTDDLPAGVDVDRAVRRPGQGAAPGADPVGGAFVRLLDSTGEFTAEVVTSAGRRLPVLRRPRLLDRPRAVPRRQRPGQRRRDAGINQLDIVAGLTPDRAILQPRSPLGSTRFSGPDGGIDTRDGVSAGWVG